MRRRRCSVASLMPVLVAAMLGLGLWAGLGLAGMLVPYQDETFGVHQATDYTKTVDLGDKAIVEGFIIVTNGKGDITFSIEDPNGRYVYERYVVAGERFGGFSSFSSEAGVPGSYTLHFDNRSDQDVAKLVFLHYRVRYNSLRISRSPP